MSNELDNTRSQMECTRVMLLMETCTHGSSAEMSGHPVVGMLVLLGEVDGREEYLV